MDGEDNGRCGRNVKKGRRHSSSGDSPPPPALPSELVVEILCNLPVKCLLRFRCACKGWKSLICDPKFAKIHLRCSSPDFTRRRLIISHNFLLTDYFYRVYPLLSVFSTASSPFYTSELENPLYNNTDIVGSCGGIICLYNPNYKNTVLLWNPSTRRFKTLPSLDNTQLGNSFTTLGFGYDHFADRYKVVAVFCLTWGRRRTQVKVYTLGTHSWRKIQEFPECAPFENQSGTFVSGALNWLVTSSVPNWFIISLDLGNESYQKLLLPAGGGGSRIVADTLGVLRDCLCFLQVSYDVLHVWLMKEYGNQESWTKLTSFGMEQFRYGRLCALHISEDDELLLSCGSNLFLYNSRDNTIKTPLIKNITSLAVPGIYVESLISLSPCQ